MKDPLLFVAVPLVAVFGIECARWLALRHARLDLPDRRRLHTLPTPRGGGLGLVLAWLMVLCAPAAFRADVFVHPSATAFAVALALVALVGALDDRYDLSIRARLVVHIAAAALVAWSFLGSGRADQAYVPALVVLSFAGVASINLHNFMDGLNGFLSLQTLFVLLALALLAGLRGDTAFVHTCLLFALALLVFLPFNFPRARIFLGDVGSGSIGLVIGAMILAAVDRDLLGWGSAVVLCSAFVLDAGATLLLRLRTTRLWHQGHRSHLYQWLWRRRVGVVRINAIYQAWNLVVVLPVLLMMARWADSLIWECAAAFLVYGFGLILWHTARRALRRTHRAQYRP